MTFDSPSWREERNAKLLEWFGGNQSAVDFYVAFSAICELWDDLTDKDKEPTKEDVDDAFWHSLVTLPANEFFAQHRQFFMPLILQVINAWKDSVEMERGSKNDRAYALTLRYFGLQIAPMIVTVLRGPIAARSMSVEFWHWATHDEDAIDWINKGEKND